ncbi:MAG: prepilin-type N-terminal cleavage/methylation domain-containing protein [Armatimonadetes bacterium]|nr:prepilin-type N-terminal cleavage/methylation domain-containing protein [Armatimonadota bacterium]
MSRQRGGRAAFTLIELLVVIAIIAILAGIILPVYNHAQEKARQNQCSSNMSSLSVALKLYKQDYRRYPLGSLAGNIDNLPDGSNPAYSAAAYNTISVALGRKTRINALHPAYIEDPKSLICPDENGDTDLIAGTDGAGSYNGFDTKLLLSTENDINGDGSVNAADWDLDGDGKRDVFASTYDDYYNVFGYLDSGSDPFGLGPGTPAPTTGSAVGGGRKSPRLSNAYAPGQTIVTACREHEEFFSADSAIDLIVRLEGGIDREVRVQYDWRTQAQGPSD